ncbi:MAG: B12-binding domain-containing radical SAM protein [Candidatus Helarchaeota archaeon]
MKILLINPTLASPVVGLDRFIKAPPLGLMSIAGTVPDHEVEILDLKYRKLLKRSVRKKISRADVVGVTCLTPSYSATLKLCQIAKEEGVPTIVGGYHPTLVPEIVEKPEIDYIIRGEGELTFPQLIDAISKGTGLDDVLGVSYTQNGAVYHNPPRPLIEDLDTLPFPRRDLVRHNYYTYFGSSVDVLESARGCAHDCHFCCVIQFHQRKWRKKSPERVIQELQQMNPRRSWFIFQDSEFTLSMKRVKRICDLIIEHGLENKWYSAQGRVDDVVKHSDVVDRMAEAGFKMLFIGIESIFQKSLEKIGKKITIDQIKEAVKILHNHGISIFGSIIIGNIGESKEDVRKTIRFARELDIDIMQFTPLTPYPQTRLFKEAMEKGWIKDPNYDNWNLCHPIMATPDLTIEEIHDLVIEAYRNFYLEGVRTNFLLRGGKRMSQRQFRWFWRMMPEFLANSIPAIFKFVQDLSKRN